MKGDERKTLTVPVAGRRYFGLGKNASYEAVRRGEIPVIKIGSRLRVPVVALEKMLEDAGRFRDAPPVPAHDPTGPSSRSPARSTGTHT
jgi:hypothetical protein